MKENKTENLHLRLTIKEKELLEDLANSFYSNGTNLNLSQAVIQCMMWAQRIMLKNNTFRPINRREVDVQKEIEQHLEITKKLGVQSLQEVVEVANYNWLEDVENE